MKKTIVTTILCLATLCAMASHWDGPMGIYLKTNTSSKDENAVSRNFRLSSSDWGDNAYSSTINHTSELNGVDLGEITSLKLDGGIYIGGRDDTDWPHHWYETGDFKLQYCVYRQGETAPDWSACELLTLDNEVSKTETDGGVKIQYIYDATDKDVNLIALTNKTAGTYVLRVRMLEKKHYWNENGSNGTWTEYSNAQEATFTIKNYVTGNGHDDANGNFCGGEKWYAKYDAGLLNEGSKTYRNVKAGSYKFKIITGSWENVIGYDRCDTEHSFACAGDNENNICFTLALPADVTIQLVNNQIILTTSPVYFITGSMNSWNTASADYRLIPEDGYVKTLSLGAGEHKLRVVNGKWPANGGSVWNYTNLDADVSSFGCYQGTNATDKNICFKLSAAADVTIQFNPVTEKISITTTAGCFNGTPYSITGETALTGEDWLTNGDDMTNMGDGSYQHIETNKYLTTGTYKYKVLANRLWYDGCVYPVGHGNDAQVTIPETGVYTLTYTFVPASKTLTCNAVRQTKETSVSQYQYSTFYSDKAWNVPEGLTALIFTGVENEMLVMESIDVIPAETGVVLYGAANATYTLAETETNVTYLTNLLHGTLGNTEINNSNVHYILGLSSQGECGMFWPYNTDHGVGAFTNNAGKAYLELPNDGSPAPARIRGFVFSAPSVATGVYDADIQEADGTCYDLLGRKVSNPQQGGLYIMNGKKIIIL